MTPSADGGVVGALCGFSWRWRDLGKAWKRRRLHDLSMSSAIFLRMSKMSLPSPEVMRWKCEDTAEPLKYRTAELGRWSRIRLPAQSPTAYHREHISLAIYGQHTSNRSWYQFGQYSVATTSIYCSSSYRLASYRTSSAFKTLPYSWWKCLRSCRSEPSSALPPGH